MALVVENIHIGPSRMFVGITNPTTGAPPTLAPHTAGVPTPGTEVGYTTGDTIFRKANTTFDVRAEQAMGPVAVGLDTEMVEMESELLERTPGALRAAFDNVGFLDDGSKTLFYGGGSQYAIRTQSIMLTSLRPNQAGKYEVAVIYKAFSPNGFETAFRRTAASTFRLLLRGLYDSGRTVGDQAFQYYIEK